MVIKVKNDTLLTLVYKSKNKDITASLGTPHALNMHIFEDHTISDIITKCDLIESAFKKKKSSFPVIKVYYQRSGDLLFKGTTRQFTENHNKQLKSFCEVN